MQWRSQLLGMLLHTQTLGVFDIDAHISCFLCRETNRNQVSIVCVCSAVCHGCSFVYVYCVCLSCMFIVCVYCVCLLCVFIVYVYCVCLLCMFVYVYCVCLLCVFIVYVYCVCVLCMFIVCVYCVCVLCMFIVYVYCGPGICPSTLWVGTGIWYCHWMVNPPHPPPIPQQAFYTSPSKHRADQAILVSSLLATKSSQTTVRRDSCHNDSWYMQPCPPCSLKPVGIVICFYLVIHMNARDITPVQLMRPSIDWNMSCAVSLFTRRCGSLIVFMNSLIPRPPGFQTGLGMRLMHEQTHVWVPVCCETVYTHNLGLKPCTQR